jgi:hypothetical protein
MRTIWSGLTQLNFAPENQNNDKTMEIIGLNNV